jgi:hypothetical protein
LALQGNSSRLTFRNANSFCSVKPVFAHSSIPPQFWADCHLQAPPPAVQGVETSLAALESEAQQPDIRVNEGGSLKQPLLDDDGDVHNNIKHSPFSVPKDFFTPNVSSPGYTSVPALIVCAYAFRKGILDNASIVGHYDGLLGSINKSKLLCFVTFLSFLFFLIPWAARHIIFYNYSRNPGDLSARPCVVYDFAAEFFFVCTSVILGSGVHKALHSSLEPLVVVSPFIFSSHRRCSGKGSKSQKTSTNFLPHKLPSVSTGKVCEWLLLKSHTMQALRVFASIHLMSCIIGCNVVISQTWLETICASDLNITQ